jgi:hypothetical protein
MEVAGDTYAAAQIRLNVAYDLANHGRFSDALLYAQAALRDFQTFGRAADEIQKTQRLIARIRQDQALAAQNGGGTKP